MIYTHKAFHDSCSFIAGVQSCGTQAVQALVNLCGTKLVLYLPPSECTIQCTPNLHLQSTPLNQYLVRPSPSLDDVEMKKIRHSPLDEFQYVLAPLQALSVCFGWLTKYNRRTTIKSEATTRYRYRHYYTNDSINT